MESNGDTTEYTYIGSINGLVAVNIRRSGESDSLFYIHTDYLGSVMALTDASGAIREEYSYDAWGRRRDPDDWGKVDTRTDLLIDRGYTGHEHLAYFSLINMNGRVYDPATGSMLSPDPIINPGMTQGLNRYSYVLNNPLKYTDPTGFYLMHNIYGNGYDIDVSNHSTVNAYMASDGRGGSGGSGGGGGGGPYYWNEYTGEYTDRSGNHVSQDEAVRGTISYVYDGPYLDKEHYEIGGISVDDGKATILAAIWTSKPTFHDGYSMVMKYDGYYLYYLKTITFSIDINATNGGDGFLNYNENVGKILKANNLETGIINTTAAIASKSPKGIYMSLAKYMKLTGQYAKTAKIFGAAGVGVSVLANGYEFATGTDNMSTWVDIGITAVGVGVGIAFGTAAVPIIAVGGLAYGVFSIAGGSDWINENWGYK